MFTARADGRLLGRQPEPPLAVDDLLQLVEAVWVRFVPDISPERRYFALQEIARRIDKDSDGLADWRDNAVAAATAGRLPSEDDRVLVATIAANGTGTTELVPAGAGDPRR